MRFSQKLFENAIFYFYIIGMKRSGVNVNYGITRQCIRSRQWFYRLV
ncbi:hypothetical protein HMPREF2531_03250 [Bacteroides intestinalis]|uniref:Uncharacterized protein n=1 Tax=Bacteroides intestinalis TaxID=329854 RepID=A0A139L3M8_9BACE|nr:hypothetical protein HMPREF2531_03250 [Bacteroides intestinalis]